MSDHTVYGIIGTLVVMLLLVLAFEVGGVVAKSEIRLSCDNLNSVMLQVEHDRQTYLCIRKSEVEKARF